MIDDNARFRELRAEPSSDAPRDPARLARVEHTRAEMMTQGAAIVATLAAEHDATRAIAARLAGRTLRRVIVTGCGDSWFVGQAARYAFEATTGAAAEGIEALDLAAYGSEAIDEASLVIGLSASGTTPAVVDALARAQRQGAFTIGLCNRANTKLQTQSDAGLVVHATRKGWPTQSSSAAIALLVALAIEIGRTGTPARRDRAEALRHALADLPGPLDALALAIDAEARVLATRIADAGIVLVAGAGPHAVTAAFGAAKLRELGPIHAIATPLEELHHYRAQKPGEALILIAPDGASRARALDAAIVNKGVGGRMIAILGGDNAEIEARALGRLIVPPAEPALAPILHGVAVHLLAYHFAVARAARGLGAHPPVTSPPA